MIKNPSHLSWTGTSALALLLLLSLACTGPSTPSPASTAPLDLAGTWRAVLTTPGGDLPFGLRFAASTPDGDDVADNPSGWSAWVLNGEEELPTSGVQVDGQKVEVAFAWYDSEITASLNEQGELHGEWRRTAAQGEETRLPFRATAQSTDRFTALQEEPAPGAQNLTDISGTWAVEFREAGQDKIEPAQGELQQDGPDVLGTFLTPTGDYRFLAGSYDQGWLRLSTFDGAHAFLFHARAQADGQLEGDFWSRDTYHATWTARPASGDEDLLPNAWEEVGLTNDEGRFHFAFESLEGQPVAMSDARFDGKVVLVNIFGSWCPNCNDEAPLLATWDRRYRDRGLEIVGLAYEFSGDPERDRTMVKRFGERHGIEYPLLLAGISDKAAAAATLPDLTAVLSYPTTIFIGRDGRVRRIHSGFTGPGTGAHYDALVHELEGSIEDLLQENSATGGSASS